MTPTDDPDRSGPSDRVEGKTAMGLELISLEHGSGHQSGGNLVSEPKDHRPDIMTELLLGKAPQVTTQENDLIERLAFYLKRLEQRAGSPEPSPEPQPARRTRAPRTKKKATYYLTKALIRKLDAAQQTLVDLTEGTGAPKISKSLIVELALKTMLKDLEVSGRSSRLLKLITGIPKKNARKHENAEKTKHGEGEQ